MKNSLGIIGSPRKLGNSEIMIKETSRNNDIA
jgi:multimeric flavodoxin WrbA